MHACVLVGLTLLVLISKHVHGLYSLTIFAGTGIQGNSGNNVPATSADINFAAGTWVDSNGVTYFADTWASVIRRVGTDGIITTIGGTGVTTPSNSGGKFTSVALYNPWGIVGDSSFLYISDSYHIWKYQLSSGIVSVLLGTTSVVDYPKGLWLNSDNSLYFVEYSNSLLRKINLGTNIISTVAGGGGSGNSGDIGDGGPAVSTNTKFYLPHGVYIDTNGVIFMAAGRIRYIVNGIINTYAGGGPSSNTADGFIGTNAYFSTPYDVKGDTMGNIFVVESAKVRVVDYSTKAVTTYLPIVSNARGMWLDYMNGRSMIGMFKSVKTAPLYVNPVPTASPTTAPTVLQSKTPTATPSFASTVRPTFTSSKIPTATPTALPPTFPTETPSASRPTFHPTRIPSLVPTAIPTSPSAMPSREPSSSQPTFRPSAAPSFSPTVSSQTPSKSPIHGPTSNPTTVPSFVPIANPTSSPSAMPSSEPSSCPSAQPTLSPTAPTFRPTRAPSLSPTIKNDDVVKVSGTSRLKFVNGQTLNKVSLATLVSAFQNISENAQSTEITSTVMVVQSSPQLVRRGRAASKLMSGQAIPSQLSYIYDIGFLSTYVMTYHASYTSSQLAALKTTKVRQAIEVGQFESALRSLAQARNATQLLNGSCSEVRSLDSAVVPSSSSLSDSKDDDTLSTETVAGIVIGILGGCLVLGVVLYVILKRYDDEKKREEMERKSSGHITAL